MPTLRSKAITLLQKLRRLEEADDKGYVRCVTCGAPYHWKDCDGGHFIPKGNSSYWALRLPEHEVNNIFPQCKYCNGFAMRYGTGQAAYTIFMQDKYGAGVVQEMLDCKGKVRKITKGEYRDMIEDFKAQIKIHLERVGG